VHADHANTARPTRAFTLVEVMLVCVVLAVIASMVLPRLIGTEHRQLELATDRVADLLTMFAQRESMSSKPVGIWLDAQRHALAMVVLDIDPQQPEQPAEWRIDRLARPVMLPDLIEPDGVAVTSDGWPIDISEWPVATEPGHPRPEVTLTLIATSGETRTLVLPGHALAPYRDDGGPLVAHRTPIDLDDTGRYREDW